MVGPLELFYDLAVVVLIAQDAHHLAGHLTWGGLGEFVVLFTLIWIAWANGSLYHELHGHEDARGGARVPLGRQRARTLAHVERAGADQPA